MLEAIQAGQTQAAGELLPLVSEELPARTDGFDRSLGHSHS
jgi:hypothetical protein